MSLRKVAEVHEQLSGYRTYLMCVLYIVYGLVSWGLGYVDLNAALQMALQGATAIYMRRGLPSTSNPIPAPTAPGDASAPVPRSGLQEI